MSTKARAAKAPAGPSLGTVVSGHVSSFARATFDLVACEDGARAVLAVLVASAIVASSGRVRARVLERQELAIDRTALDLSLPASLGPSAGADVAALPLPRRVSAFDPALVPAVALSLRGLGWVDKVDQVRLDYPPRLRFKVTALEPVARLRDGNREWLCARDGRSVPVEKVSRPADGFARIDGLPSESHPGDRALALDAGLGLITALEARGLAQRLALVAVDVSNWNGKKDPRASELVIETAHGTKIEWGRPAGAPRAPSNDERLKTLEQFLARGPKLETLARVSLRWQEPVVTARPTPEPPKVAETAARPAKPRG